MKKTVYLDYAASSPLDKRVLEKMMPHFTENFGNADSLHGYGRRGMAAVDDARDGIAQLLGVHPDEIYFTSGGAEGDNWAVKGIARAMKAQGKTHIVLSAIEHHAVVDAARSLEKEGFTLSFVSANEGGMVEPSAVLNAMNEDTGLVCVMWVNNETGTIQPIEEIAKAVKSRGAVFFTDAVQAVPHMAIDLKKYKDVDAMAISGHKFYGPKGAGVLFLRRGVKAENLIDSGQQQRGKRGGTVNTPAVVGLYEALRLTWEELSEREEKIKALRELFLKEIETLDGVAINGKNTVLGLLNLKIDGVENDTLLRELDLNGVAISVGAACASGAVEPSAVLLSMGLTREDALSSVRLSFGKELTEDDVLFAAQVFKKAVENLRKR